MSGSGSPGCPADTLHECLLGLIANRTVSDLTYDELQQIAAKWIIAIDAFPAPLAAERDRDFATVPALVQSRDFARVAMILRRRYFGRYWQWVKPRTSFERGLFELFLLARLHPYVVAYLSLQEGRDWEGSSCQFLHTSKLITQSLAMIGKHQLLSIRLRFYFVRVRINLDPTRQLRSMYVGLLRRWRTGDGAESGGAGLAVDLLFFRLKAWLLRRLLRWLVEREQNLLTEARLRRVFQGKSFRRNVSLFILILFPGAKRLGEPEWRELFAQMETYFVPRACVLSEILPEDSVRNHGIIKLVKIAFGVIAGRLAARTDDGSNESQFIFDTLRLAYSWGITYPLIDNILDSNVTVAEVRSSLVAALRQLFTGKAFPDQVQLGGPLVKETVDRLAEVISVVPLEQRSRVKKTLNFLLEAHQRDAERRLASVGTTMNDEIERGVWADSVLKATLIRVATMEVCGTAADHLHLAEQFRSSLINQLGDDLWDTYEDLDDDRVTPFTAFLTGRSRRNPFRFFLRYCLATSATEPEKRRMAMIIGLQETARCLLESIKERGQDPLGVTRYVDEFLSELDVHSSTSMIAHVPHVDPDAVLFGLEKSLLA